MKNKIKKTNFLVLIFTFFMVNNYSLAVGSDLLGAGNDIKDKLNSLQSGLVTLMAVSFLYVVVIFIKDVNFIKTVVEKDGKKTTINDNKSNLAGGLIVLFTFFTIGGIVAYLQASTFGDEVRNDLHTAPDVTIKPYN